MQQGTSFSALNIQAENLGGSQRGRSQGSPRPVAGGKRTGYPFPKTPPTLSALSTPLHTIIYCYIRCELETCLLNMCTTISRSSAGESVAGCDITHHLLVVVAVVCRRRLTKPRIHRRPKHHVDNYTRKFKIFNYYNKDSFNITCYWQGIGLVIRRSLVPILAGHHCVVALGKLLTPVCLCHQTV